MTDTENDTETDTTPSTTEEQSQQPETPTNIHTQDTGPKYEDIEMPENANHKSVIEIQYKRYFMLFGLAVFLLLGTLFGSGVLSIQETEVATIVSSVLIIPLFLLFWLFESRANS